MLGGDRLSAEEVESLREVGRPVLDRGRIPQEHKRKLARMGLVADLLGGVALTEAGRARLKTGGERLGS